MVSLKKDVSDEELKSSLLHKFFRMRAGVKRHIYESDVPKGFPPYLRKKIMKMAEELYRKGLLRKFPHGKENVWQLNIERIEEIKEIIKRFYPI